MQSKLRELSILRTWILGDSVLQLTITEYLFLNYKHKAEGELTKIKFNSLWKLSLWSSSKFKFIFIYAYEQGEELTGGRERVSIQADSVEAVIAAIYLDNGLEKAKKFIFNNFSDIIKKQ